MLKGGEVEQLLNLNVVGKPLLYSFYALSALTALGLLLRPVLLPGWVRRSRSPAGTARAPKRRRPKPLGRRTWLITAGAAIAGGALAGGITLFVCEAVLNVFGLPLDADTRAWVIFAFAGAGLAAVNLWRSRWWRKAAAVVAGLLFIATAALGINAGYGLNPTLGAMLGMNQTPHLALPKLNPKRQQQSGTALWQSWKAPAGMPATGRSGAVTIPATVSGFHARDAYLYLPPAALVDNPPALPVVIMMMGQPGGPEQNKSAVQAAQRPGAAQPRTGPDLPHHRPAGQSLPESRLRGFGQRQRLHLRHHRRRQLHPQEPQRGGGRTQWAVAGYSNGGECALSFGGQKA